MTSFKLIFKNVHKNLRDYLIYFLTLMLSVSLFYAFNSISDQPAFSEMGMTRALLYDQLGILLSALSVLIAIVLAFLIIYANQFLLKRRKKELGIYVMLGMKKGRISRIFAGETFCVGVIALVVGLILGFILSQGISMIALKLFAIELDKYQLVFSMGAFRQTVICFALIFFLVMLFNVWSVSSVQLIDLLTASRKNERLKSEKSGGKPHKKKSPGGAFLAVRHRTNVLYSAGKCGILYLYLLCTRTGRRDEKQREAHCFVRKRMKMKKRIVVLLMALVLAVGLIGCKDTLKSIVHKASGTSDEVQEEDTTRWADQTSDPLIIQGIADSSAKFATATADGCLYAVFNGIWSRQTSYFTVPSGTLSIMGCGTAEGTQRFKVAVWKKVDGGAEYVADSTYYIHTDGTDYRCTISGLDPAAQYRVTISYDSSKYYLYGLLKVEGIG